MTDFKVGDDVLVVSQLYGGRASWKRDQVEKVHKTGRFVLKHRSGQWRPDGSPTGQRYSMTGPNVRVEHFSQDRLAEFLAADAAAAVMRKVRGVGGALSRIQHGADAARLWELMPDELKELAE